MWWMLKNHDPSGSSSGTSDNLQNWNYASHATYLATVASHAAAAWNITFASVEAFNEPIAAWCVISTRIPTVTLHANAAHLSTIIAPPIIIKVEGARHTGGLPL